jgi:hypothetical protein
LKIRCVLDVVCRVELLYSAWTMNFKQVSNITKQIPIHIKWAARTNMSTNHSATIDKCTFWRETNARNKTQNLRQNTIQKDCCVILYNFCKIYHWLIYIHSQEIKKRWTHCAKLFWEKQITNPGSNIMKIGIDVSEIIHQW